MNNMSIKMTYHSIDIAPNLNVFIESFGDNIFDIILMKYPSCEFDTLGTICTHNEDVLNVWINETIRRFK